MCLVTSFHLVFIFLLIPLALTGTIVSNIPTVVTSNKNYTTSSPTWVTSPYFRAGQEAVISQYTGSNQYPFRSYTFTYSSALPGVPNLAYGIQGYKGNDYFGEEFYEIRQTGRTATTFSVQIQIFGWTNLWILSVAYIAVDPTFPHHLNSFDNVPINYTAGDVVNITQQVSYLTYYVNYINYTAQASGMTFTKFTQPYSRNYIVIFMTSLWIKGAGSPLQLHVYPQVVNSSHYLWNITLYQRTLVTNLHFSEIIFNSDDVESSKKYFIVFQKWYNDMNGGFIEIPIEFVDNFIMAVTSFEALYNSCGFVYQWQFVTKNIGGVDTFGIQLLKSWHVNNRCGFSLSQSSIFYMMTWRCQAPYHYFNLTSNLCQTLCGGFNLENQANFTCDPCANSKCYQCDPYNTDLCTDCASYLNYELASGRCVCMPRHMAANESCLHCSYDSVGCINCTYDDGQSGTLPYNSALFTCVQCNNTENYFLTGSSCTLCTLSDCVYCQNLTACAVCASSYDYSDIQTCIQCLVTGCLNCSYSNANKCTTCNTTMGYYNNATTQKCSTVCGDGIYVPATEGCDDGNNDNYDGCSSSCLVQSHFGCSGSPSQCFFASEVAIMMDSQLMETDVCNTITFKLRFTPASDTFAQSYVNWTQFVSTPNASILQQNHSMSSYSSGVISLSFFLLAHLQNNTLIFQFSFPSLLPSIFNLTRAEPLSFTVSTSPSALMICCDGYLMTYDPLRCVEICGDGRLYVLECDDGNLVDGDGCSSKCTVEHNYVCMNGTANTSSICSYNGTFMVALDAGDKHPTSNSLTLTYDFSPPEPLIVLNNNSLDMTSMVSFPLNPGVTVTQATIDPSTKKLVIKVDYTQNLQDNELALQITPPNVPQAVLIPKISQTWTVSPTNQLSAVVYSQSDYDIVSKLTPFATTILGLYLGIVALSVLSRKFIGLQLATLIQISYLSLLQNKEITTYQQPISNWQHVFGYSQYYMAKLPAQRFRSPYALYGFQTHFGYSNNMMVIVAASTFGVSVVLLMISMVTSSITAKRLKKVAFLIANELCYALIVFITPSMVTAVAIEAQEGTITDSSMIWSKSLLISGMLMLLSIHFLNLSTADQNPDVGTYFRKHTKLGIYMPIIFNIRLVTLTILLFIYYITPTVTSYLLLIVQMGYVMLIVFGRPFRKIFDLVRSAIIEVSLLYTLSMRFVEVHALADQVPADSALYPIIAFVQYGCYSLAVTLSSVSIVYHTVKKFKPDFKVRQEPPSQKQQSYSPERNLVNDSQAIMGESPSKKYPDNPLIFDMEDMQVDLPQTSVMSLDSKRLPRKKKGGWRS